MIIEKFRKSYKTLFEWEYSIMLEEEIKEPKTSESVCACVSLQKMMQDVLWCKQELLKGSMNDIKLSIGEISELEHMKYLLEEHFDGFEFEGTIEENEEEAKRQRPFDVYLLFKQSKELVELLNKYIFERYYDGKEVEIKRNAQREYCDEGTSTPNFADFGTNSKGECLNCRKNIWKHITLKKASNKLITGCPCCSRSYCD